MIIVNEKTFEEQFYFRIQIKFNRSLILLVSSIMGGTFFLISSTPVKEFIPGYPSSELRLEAMKNTFLLDSIIKVTQQQEKFLESIKNTLIGKDNQAIVQEYVVSNNESQIAEYSVTQVKEDSILRSRVIQEDKYNFTRSNETNLMSFISSARNFSKFDHSKYGGIDIALSENYPVKSILGGRVIFAEWTSETGM